MRYRYVVILKKNSEAATDFISILLCLFSAFVFSYVQISAGVLNYYLCAMAVVLFAGPIIYFALRRRYKVRYRYWLMIAGVGWLGMHSLAWAAVFFFALAFLEYQTKKPLEIGFQDDHVIINTLISRRFEWAAFHNIVLKDGLLTLDFANNKLMQREVVDDEDEDDADEEEFNAFCRQQLAAVHA